jgi:hypothetical protein
VPAGGVKNRAERWRVVIRKQRARFQMKQLNSIHDPALASRIQHPG